MTVDPALVWAFLTALVAGVTRGFSGFGGALIFVPLVSAAYGPRVAAPSLLVIDTLLTLPFVIPALRACVWRQVAPLAVGAVVAVPAGVWVLGRTDPLVLRWGAGAARPRPAGAAGLRLAPHRPAQAADDAGRRRCRRLLRRRGADVGPGGGGLLARQRPALRAGAGQPVRLFFALVTLASGTAYAFSGMLTAEVGRLALLLGPAYALGLYAGARAFRGASDRHYRVAAYWVIAAAAVLSLPLFDLLLGR
ncbi:TSUP family transporter [Ancylobacter dichloromethanicus]